MDNIKAWLLLNRTKGLGTKRINALLSYYGNIENIFKEKRFPSDLNIPQSLLNSIKNTNQNTIKNDLQWLEKENNFILTIDDDLYPPLLKNAQSPPAILFITGDVGALLLPQLAVVGSRNASAVGLRNTKSFCFDLAKGGLAITSGMALGVDGAAHKAAIEANGKTIAVMGTGLDSVYPPKHKELAHLIAQNGALVSEFPTNTKPHAFNFPKRNRIICGLSLGTLVIEAGVKSGTLITARLTMEINRPVMAIPGSIHSPLVKGCHLLIKQGAKLIESSQEILEELTPLAQSLSLQISEKLNNLEKESNNSGKNQIKLEINDEHQKVLDIIMYDSTPLETIVSKSKMSVQEVASILLILELEEKIQALNGAQYVRI